MTVFCLFRPSTKRQRSLSPENGNLKKFRLPKPPYTYTGMIALAIESQPDKTICTHDLYEFLRQLFPFFRTAYNEWTNSIRKVLRSHKSFTCVTSMQTGNSVWKVDLSTLPRNTFDLKKNTVDAENWAPTLFQQVNMPEIVLPPPVVVGMPSVVPGRVTAVNTTSGNTADGCSFNPDLNICVDDIFQSVTSPERDLEIIDDSRRGDIFDNSPFQFFALPRPLPMPTLPSTHNVTSTKEFQQLQHLVHNQASSLLVSPEVAVNNLRLLCDSVTSIFSDDTDSKVLHQTRDSMYSTNRLLDNLEKDVDIADLVNISLLN